MMKLVEKGLVDLDSPVIKYIPEFRTKDIENSNKITIRMLLNHSSGIIRDLPFEILTLDKYNKYERLVFYF